MQSVSEPSSLSALFESLDTPLLALGNDGIVRHLNDAAEQFFGRSRQRLVGTRLEGLEPAGLQLASIAGRVASSGLSQHASILREGAELAVSANPWWDGDQVLGIVLLIQTPRLVAPAQGKADIAALAAGLAHEVRNPLAALRGATELLASELDDVRRTEVKEYLDLILRETSRVDTLVGRLLNVARPLTLQRAEFRGDEVLHDLALQARALAQARGIPVTVEELYDPGLPKLRADRERLFEALVNLVKNAVEALPPQGGRITLSAGLDAKRRRTGTAERSLIQFRITDTGPGFGAARDRLFTPFFTTKAAGTGLGLLLTRRVIEAHGGVLTMHDRPAPETGAEVQVLLPLETDDG